jgi:hypothetical protein
MSAEEFKQFQKFDQLKGKKEPIQNKPKSNKEIPIETPSSQELVVPEKTKRKCTEKQRAALEKAREALVRKTLAKSKKK